MRPLVALLLVTVLVGPSACADTYRDWLDGKISPRSRTGPALFSDAEWQALPDRYDFDYRFQQQNGIATPTLNGRNLMGVEYRYAPVSLAQLEYDTRLLAAAGVNVVRSSMRSVAAEGGEPAEVDRWRAKEEVFRRRGIASLLAPSAMVYSGDIIRNLYDRALRRQPPAAFTQWSGAFGKGGLYGDFFNPDYRAAHGQVLADLLRELGPTSTVGYVYSDEPPLIGVGPKTPAADADWRAFLQRFYVDRTPAEDTNGDGATFNRFASKQYAAWNDVPQFTADEAARNPAISALVSVWMRWGHARLIDAMSAQTQQVLGAATVSEAYVRGPQVSLLNAMPHNRYIGFGNYNRIAQTAYYAAAAHAYDKPGYTFHINRPKSNYWGARHIGVASLPFTAGQIWWHLSVGVGDGIDADYGRNYSLADWWEVNDPRVSAWGGKANRIVEYDSRFLIIPQLAPFLGRFDSMPEELANSVLWLDPPVVDLVRNNHAVSEEALVLGEQRIALDRYKLVIYLKRGPAQFAETYTLLRDYVRRGGTVLVNLNEVGAGETVFGQPNAAAWLAPYAPGRQRPGALTSDRTVIYEDNFRDTRRWERERYSHEGPSPLASAPFPGIIGAYPHGASGSFVYRFQIPNEYERFRITDTHYVWGKQNKTQMWISNDNRSWVLQHDDGPRDNAPYEWSKTYSVAGDLGGRRELYVKYFFLAGDPGRPANDNRGAALQLFRLEGLTSDDGASAAEWQGKHATTTRLSNITVSSDELEPYVLPGTGMPTAGEVSDSKGARRPLVIVRNEGEGRWVVWNSPSSIPTVVHDNRRSNAAPWRAQWDLIDAVVRQHTQGRIEDYDQPYILQGQDCLMAATWEGASGDRQHPVQFTSPDARSVVYEVLDGVSEGGAFIATQQGVGEFTKDLSNAGQAAHVWVIKPYGWPILLCADGTVKHMLRIGDGTLTTENGAQVLRFEMAEKAAISAPTAPKSATHNGQPARVEYDAATHIARIEGGGRLGECEVRF